MSGSTTTVPIVDLNLLTTRLAHVASSIQGVALDAQVLAKTPQAAFAEAPPWAIQLIATTEEILDENKRLRKDNQDLKNGLVQTFRRLDDIPCWAARLFDDNKGLREETRQISQTCSHILSEHAKLIMWSADISEAVTKIEHNTKHLEELKRLRAESHLSAKSSPETNPGSSTPLPKTDESQLSITAPFLEHCMSQISKNDSLSHASEVHASSNLLSGQKATDRDPAYNLGSSIGSQWESARAKNGQVRGSLNYPFVALALPPGNTLAFPFPRTHTLIGKQTTSQLQTLLSAYNQPIHGKNHDQLLADFRRFIGVQDVQEQPTETSNASTPGVISLDSLSPAIWQQWEVARSLNSEAQGTADSRFTKLAFPPGAKSGLTVPGTIDGIKKMDARYIQLLLSAYQQPTIGKSYEELLSNYLGFIGLKER